jgi:hypothetical protein
MKGSAIGYGGILAMLIITTFVFMYITAKPPIERYVITSEGALMNFANEAEMLIKTFDTSVEFISQRSAYELGLTGGLENEKHWTKDYPDITTLEEELEKAIENNLPASNIKGNMKITFSDGDIDTTYSCGSIESSRCFLVDGSIFMNFYDNATKSVITLNSHEFDATIASNYFRLLKASRSIMEESEFNSFLENGDLTTLSNAFKADSRFANLRLDISVSGRVVEFTIYDRSCLSGNDYYCIAPLKAWETGIINPKDGKQIAYDYVKLKFNVDIENAIAPEGCARANPTVTIAPDTQAGSSGSTLTYTIFVKNNDNSDCGNSFFSLNVDSCPPNWVCDLSNSFVSIPPGSTDDTIRLFVTSTSTASTGLYTFNVRATNSESANQGQDSGIYSISSCTGSFSATVSGTGTCTVYTSFSASNCDGKSWEIREGFSVKKSGIVSGNPYTNNPSLTGVSTGDHTYRLFINGNPIGDAVTLNCIAYTPPPQCPGGCDDNNPCTSDSCQSGTCVHTNRAAGSICGTISSSCPNTCTGGNEYRDGTESCNLVCNGAGSCSSTCTLSSCSLSSYTTVKECKFDCSGTSCITGYYCQPAKAYCRVSRLGWCDGCSSDGCCDLNGWVPGGETCSYQYPGGCYETQSSIPRILGTVTCKWSGWGGTSAIVSTCEACDEITEHPEEVCSGWHGTTCQGYPGKDGIDPVNYCKYTSCYMDSSNCKYD